MTRSMTGFATKTITVSFDAEHRAYLELNLKSLNSRFFEATCRLPYQLNNLETAIVKNLSKKLRRGHVYLSVYIDNQNMFKGGVTPALHVVQGYIDAAKLITKECNVAGQLSLNDILQLPNVFSIEDLDLSEQARETFFAALEELANDLIKTQQQEGALLANDIIERIAIMEKGITNIDAASAALMETQKHKIAQALQEVELDETKKSDLQKQAAYMLLDKIDIHEEIVRFKTHLASLKKQLASQEVEQGKRIDFTLQELAREINTITAKCADASISTMAIDIKVELEKAREQAQNIV